MSYGKGICYGFDQPSNILKECPKGNGAFRVINFPISTSSTPTACGATFGI